MNRTLYLLPVLLLLGIASAANGAETCARSIPRSCLHLPNETWVGELLREYQTMSYACLKASSSTIQADRDFYAAQCEALTEDFEPYRACHVAVLEALSRCRAI